jgi:uncharacterized protein
MEPLTMPGSVVNDERFTLLLLLYAKGATGRLNEPVEGITRLQKLMFLLSKDRIVAQVRKLKFEAYAFGPFRPKIYDDLAFLKNLRLLDDGTSQSNADQDASTDDLMRVAHGATAISVRDSTEYNEDVSFDFLMEGVATELPERYQTERYSLSKLGISEVENRLRRAQNDANLPKVLRTIEDVKTRFNQLPLREILRYVYKQYPESAENSVIVKDLGL